MSDDTQGALIVCVPVNVPPGAPPYPNTHYAQWSCPMCAQKMWVGPRSMKKHRDEGIPMVCGDCAVAHGVNLSASNLRSLGGL